MTTADGERLAQVTWLFGQQVADQVLAPVPPAQPSAVSSTSPSGPDSVDERQSKKRGSFDRISNVSMHALARRGMSSREMRTYLGGREFVDPEVSEEIERLESVGLLDDARLAEDLTRTLRDRKGLGRSALASELRRRQLDGSAVEEAMGSLVDDELQRAIEIAEKRAPQLRSYDRETAKRRLGAFLMRKGYSGSIVGAAVDRALNPGGPVFR